MKKKIRKIVCHYTSIKYFTKQIIFFFCLSNLREYICLSYFHLQLTWFHACEAHRRKVPLLLISKSQITFQHFFFVCVQSGIYKTRFECFFFYWYKNAFIISFTTMRKCHLLHSVIRLLLMKQTG